MQFLDSDFVKGWIDVQAAHGVSGLSDTTNKSPYNVHFFFQFTTKESNNQKQHFPHLMKSSYNESASVYINNEVVEVWKWNTGHLRHLFL